MEFSRQEPFAALPLKEQTSPRHHLFFVLNSCLILVLSSIICLETYFQGVPWDHPPLACVGADVLDSLLQRPLVNNRICCCYKGPPHYLFHICSTSHQNLSNLERDGECVIKQRGRSSRRPCSWWSAWGSQLWQGRGGLEAICVVLFVFVCFCLLVYSMCLFLSSL